MNIFDVVFSLKDGLVAFYNAIEKFLFTDIYIFLVGNVSVWSLLLGGGLVLYLIWGFVR